MLFFFLCIQEDEEGYNDGDVDDDEDEEEPGMMAVIYFFLEIYIYIYVCMNFLKSRLMFSFLLLWPIASRVELTELIQHLSHLWKLSFH